MFIKVRKQVEYLQCIGDHPYLFITMICNDCKSNNFPYRYLYNNIYCFILYKGLHPFFKKKKTVVKLAPLMFS